jgi:hypothetical protein
MLLGEHQWCTALFRALFWVHVREVIERSEGVEGKL